MHFVFCFFSLYARIVNDARRTLSYLLIINAQCTYFFFCNSPKKMNRNVVRVSLPDFTMHVPSLRSIIFCVVVSFRFSLDRNNNDVDEQKNAIVFFSRVHFNTTIFGHVPKIAKVRKMLRYRVY